MLKGQKYLMVKTQTESGSHVTVAAVVVVVPAWLVALSQQQAHRSLPRGLYSRSTVKS